MSYCRFQNTVKDLRDCQQNLWDAVSKDENEARKRLVAICKEIAAECEDDTPDEMDEEK